MIIDGATKSFLHFLSGGSHKQCRQMLLKIPCSLAFTFIVLLGIVTFTVVAERLHLAPHRKLNRIANLRPFPFYIRDNTTLYFNFLRAAGERFDRRN